MRNIYELTSARQASFGIETDSQTGWITLRDAGFGDLVLSVEVGHAGKMVDTIPSDATKEEQYNILCTYEGIDWTWAEEQERYRLLALHEYDENCPFIASYDRKTPDNAR